jgi:DUF4097 and DUF4098 domain-containing protein YvlB
MRHSRLAIILIAALISAGSLIAGERTFPAAPGEMLDIDLRTGGSIEVKGSSANEARVEWDMRGFDDDNIRVEVDKSGGKIHVRSNYIRRSGKNSGSGRFRISVPNRFDLDMNTMGGNIDIVDIKGTVSGETMGGDLVLKGLIGDLEFTTMGGNIILSDSDVDGRVKTMGGNITIDNVAGDVEPSTMGGNILLDNIIRRGSHAIDKPVNISTMGGNITVANAPHGAKVDTKGGDIVIRKSSEAVEAKTAGGNITIKEHSGSVEAETMGGNVRTVIVSGNSAQDIDIRSMGGKIELDLPANFSGTFDLEIAFTHKSFSEYKIRSDFPIRIEDSGDEDRGLGFGGKHIRGSGTVGSGKNRVRIRTVNGDIVINKH